MKVLFIINGTLRDQRQQQFLNYARFLPSGYRLKMLFLLPFDPDSQMIREFRRLGVEVESLQLRRPFGPASLRGVYRAIRSFRPAIVHTQHAISGVNGKLAGSLYRRVARRPLRIITEQRNAKHGLSRKGRLLDTWTFPLADLILCSSRGVERSFFGNAELLDPGRLNLARRRHYTFFNSIDLSQTAAGAAEQPVAPEPAPAARAAGVEGAGEAGAPIVITVAGLERQKDYPTLLRAMAALRALGPSRSGGAPEPQLLCVGEGPLEPSLRALAVELGLEDRVRFLGYRTDIDRLLQSADVFALTSRWEGLSKALLEAMSFGLPCVATAVEGTEDVIEHEQSGLLVPPGDPEAVARALRRILNDPALARRLGEGARARVRAFDAPLRARELDHIYRLLLDAPQPQAARAPAEAPVSPEPQSVSVIMSVRNGAAYLAEALESVYSQSRPPEEIVVVDDGSSDETPEILERFAARSAPRKRGEAAGVPELRVIRRGSIGRGAALNLAWQSARGEFIANLDADDVFFAGKLEAQLALFQSHPKLDLVATASQYFRLLSDLEAPGDGGERDNAPLRDPAALGDPAALRDLAALLPRYNPVNHSSVMLRRSLLERLGGYDASRRRQLDYELWIRAAVAGADLRFLDRPYTGKRLHAAQSFETRDHLRYVLSSFRLQLWAVGELQHGSGRQASGPRAAAARARLYLLAALRVAYRLLPGGVRRRLAGTKERLLRGSPPDSATNV